MGVLHLEDFFHHRKLPPTLLGTFKKKKKNVLMCWLGNLPAGSGVGSKQLWLS